MHEIYMNVSLTFYDGKIYRCTFDQSIDDAELEITPINYDKARKLMWEMVLAGGIRRVHVNWFDHNIVTVDTYIFLPM